MIQTTDIARVRFFPEGLPATYVGILSPGQASSPPPLDIRRFQPRWVRIQKIAVEARPELEMILSWDDWSLKQKTQALPDLLPTELSVVATRSLTLTLVNSGDLPMTTRASYLLWVWQPTVADKIKYQMSLSQDEIALATELGVHQSVRQGLLPLPLSWLLEREYDPFETLDHSYVLSVSQYEEAVAEDLIGRQGEVLILTGIACTSGTADQDLRIIIDRDADPDYVELQAYALNGQLTSCWIPALSELRIRLKAAAPVTANLRLIIRREMLTDVMRARWGLASPNDLPDTWAKVKGGIL